MVLWLMEQGIRDDLESHTRPVNACLDQVRQIVSTGAELLSGEEIEALEAKGAELKSRFDGATDQTDKLLRKVSAALEELHKFRTEITNFRTWMNKTAKATEEKERLLANLSRVQVSSAFRTSLSFLHRSDSDIIKILLTDYIFK